MQVRIPWRKKPVLAYPILPAPRTAVLMSGFRSAGNIRVFENGWSEEVATFTPSAIAGTAAQLIDLPDIQCVTNALIVLVRPDEPSLSETDREKLWRRYRVPVFEQRIDESCNLLAAECEAHDGLHVVSPEVELHSGERLETARCGCGKTTPRLIALERAENLRKIAAYAR